MKAHLARGLLDYYISYFFICDLLLVIFNLSQLIYIPR